MSIWPLVHLDHSESCFGHGLFSHTFPWDVEKAHYIWVPHGGSPSWSKNGGWEGTLHFEFHMVVLHREARMVVRSKAYNFQARGTSPDIAIQEVDRQAITQLHQEHRELRRTLTPTFRWEDPRNLLCLKSSKGDERMGATYCPKC